MKSIPRIGLGTYRMRDSDAEALVYDAIRIGYRHFDTAAVYRNESAVSSGVKRAINEGLVSRKDVWITTKIAPKDQGYDKCSKAILERLKLLDLDYIDLLLLHWPGSQGLKPSNPKNKENRLGSITAMHEAVLAGSVKRIGVSNFDIVHFDDIPSTVELFCNQIEFHPLLNTPDSLKLFEYCKNRKILIQAYSCLGEGKLLDSEKYPQVAQVAKELNCTSAQVLIAWALSKGCIVMPKSSSKTRLQENFESVKIKLSQDHVKVLDGMADAFGSLKFCWNPKEIV